jgi:hypothetical protein
MRVLMLLTVAGLLAACCTCPSGAANTTATSDATPAAGAAGAPRPSGEMFHLRPGVWDMFKEYRGKLTPGQDAWFAAASDGAWAWEYSEAKALALCQDQSTGPKCIVFAKNAQVLVPYRIWSGA